jgi:hypothetical protein
MVSGSDRRGVEDEMFRFVLAGILASGVLLGATSPTFAQNGSPPLTFNQPVVPSEFLMGAPALAAYGTPELAPATSQQTAGAQWMRSGMPGETAYIPGNQYIIGRRGGCALWDWASC